MIVLQRFGHTLPDLWVESDMKNHESISPRKRQQTFRRANNVFYGVIYIHKPENLQTQTVTHSYTVTPTSTFRHTHTLCLSSNLDISPNTITRFSRISGPCMLSSSLTAFSPAKCIQASKLRGSHQSQRHVLRVWRVHGEIRVSDTRGMKQNVSEMQRMHDRMLRWTVCRSLVGHRMTRTEIR